MNYKPVCRQAKLKTKKLFKKKLFFPFFFFLLFVSPLAICSLLYASEALALEQAYPEVGGLKIETITQKAQPLPQVIKYFTTWAIIIALAVILGSLIYAGIMYLTSAGKVEKAKTARDKVKQGFLGLAILAVAYLALAFVNPQLTILKIERQEVASGVVLLTKAGYDDLKNPDSSLSVMDLVDEKLAFILTTDSFDLRDQLGPLVVEEWAPGADPTSGKAVVQKVNFANIPLYGLLFWGKLANEARVFAYPLTSHELIQGSVSDSLKKRQEGYAPFVYDKKGRVEDPGVALVNKAELLSKNGFEMEIVKLNDDFFSLNQLTQFYPIEIKDYQGLAQETKQGLSLQSRNVLSPPLSIAIKTYEPGVYLYGLGSEELYLKQTENDLSKRDFAKKALFVRLQNSQSTLINGSEGDYFGGRYFTALFSDIDLKGEAKVFFPQTKPDNLAITAVEFSNEGVPLTTSINDNLNNLFAAKNFLNPNKDKIDGFVVLEGEGVYQEIMQQMQFTDRLDRGNVIENETITIYPTADDMAKDPEIDKYGLVKDVESIGVWQFSETPNTCDMVALCTEKGGTSGGGDCLVYLNPNKTDFLRLKPSQAIYPMPFYEPINLPSKAYVYKPELKVDGMKEGQLAFALTDFQDKIKSIEISPSGGCLVGLFENKTPFGQDKPTGMTRLFDSTKADLSTDPIGKCGSIYSFNKYTSQSCASSVVVYPTIPQQLIGSDPTGTGFSGTEPFMYNKNDAINKVNASLKRFNTTLVGQIISKVKASPLFAYLKSQQITLTNGETENIDPCLFVQMIIIQESLGKPKACSVDKNNNAIACGLMQVQKIGTKDCSLCSGEASSNLDEGIAKLYAGKNTCNNSLTSCSSVKGNNFWPYLIINYNAGEGGNYQSKDCQETCSTYDQNTNGGCFFPSLQVNAFPTKVECPIRRNEYNITYKYVLTVKDGYSHLRALQKANPTNPAFASCR